MNDIIQNPELRNSRIIEDFLSYKEHKKMKRKFEEYDKMAKIASLEELCLLQGSVKTKISENEQIY